MPLKAKQPEAVEKRLKLFMFGLAGIGKTTAAIQFPRPYIIDCERGCENYADLIRKAGGAVLQTTDMQEIIAEVKALRTERHDFKTLVIDPITPAYNDLLDKSETKVGSEFGRHYGVANKEMKRLANLVMSLDMNVVVTAHAKKEYGQNLAVLGTTFDGWKSLDYWFDLVVELQKRGKKRVGRVVKTRLSEQFPDEEVFEWSYDELRKRAGDRLEQPAGIVTLASKDQLIEIRDLLHLAKLPEGTVGRWFEKAGVDAWEDMSAELVGKCIEYVKVRVPGRQPVGAGADVPL